MKKKFTNMKTVSSIELNPSIGNSLHLLSLALATANYAEDEYATALLEVFNSASGDMQTTLELLEVALKRWQAQSQRERIKVVKRLQKAAQGIAAA